MLANSYFMAIDKAYSNITAKNKYMVSLPPPQNKWYNTRSRAKALLRNQNMKRNKLRIP